MASSTIAGLTKKLEYKTLPTWIPLYRRSWIKGSIIMEAWRNPPVTSRCTQIVSSGCIRIYFIIWSNKSEILFRAPCNVPPSNSTCVIFWLTDFSSSSCSKSFKILSYSFPTLPDTKAKKWSIPPHSWLMQHNAGSLESRQVTKKSSFPVRYI